MVEESQNRLIPLKTYSTRLIELAHQLLDFNWTYHKYAKHLIGNVKQQAIWEMTSNNHYSCHNTWQGLGLELGLEVLLIKRTAWFDSRDENSMGCLT